MSDSNVPSEAFIPDEWSNSGAAPRGAVFPCLECDIGFETAYALESHNTLEHPGPCKGCGQGMSTAKHLAGPLCTNAECYRRGMVTLPPLNLAMRQDILTPTPPPPSETKLKELKKLLDTHAVIAYRNGFRSRTPGSECIDISPARSSLESLYRELLLERDEARDCAREYENERNNLSKDYATLLRESNRFEAELSALRPLQLTEDERQFITDGLLLHAPGWRIPEALSEKLRISSKATSEEL